MVASPLRLGSGLVLTGQSAPASAGWGSRTVVLATASVSSSPRMSTKIAGRASSAIAPSTQNAAWKPPVSAVGAALPAWISVLVWLAATPEAIAIPIAPPSLLGGVQEPGREPGLVLLNARERGDRDGDERERGPGAGDHHRAGEVGQVVPVDGHLGCPDHARADQRHPDRHYDLSSHAGHQQLRETGERDRRQ